MEQVEVLVNAEERLGPFEWWRHALSHGGINTKPLPERVVRGLAKLRPRLIRVFIQEHFRVYPERGRFDWSLLDPYMRALTATGAQVVAAITIKPKVLYPTVDHTIWRPTDWAEWQHVIREMVKRYSVEQRAVSHWEIGNETDIGEDGGSPYLIPDPEDYFEYYKQTVEAVRQARPEAEVGGPAACWVDNEPLPGLVRLCRERQAPLDFISWHLYSRDSARHALGVEKGKALVQDWPAGNRPETFVTEWAPGWDELSLEDLAFHPRQAANAAAAALAMTDAGVDWSFYYHVWDQTFYPGPFRPFFSEKGIDMMDTHWNRTPHRLGFFGVEQEVRPHYFAHRMLSMLGDERVAARTECEGLRAVAARGENHVAVMLVDDPTPGPRSVPNTGDQTAIGGPRRVVTARFSGVEPGRKMLTIYRIDHAQRWDQDSLDMIPLERREIWASPDYWCQVHLPPACVAMVVLARLE
jgi:xylan 1,4-beta-xylosidase